MNANAKKVKTVYISNLHYKIGEEDLLGIFGKFGRVDDVMVMMKPGGKHKMGMAFVRMASHESALKAIKALHGKEIDGRTAKAVIAREDQAPKPKHIEPGTKPNPPKANKKDEQIKRPKRRKGSEFKEFLKSRNKK